MEKSDAALIFITTGVILWWISANTCPPHVEQWSLESTISPSGTIATLKPPIVAYEAIVTAYCPCEKCCLGFSDGITASGKPVTANGGRFVAADKSIPFGTMIIIPGYGTVPVLDRGGAIKGDKFDVFFPSHQEALNWGRQTLWVTIGER